MNFRAVRKHEVLKLGETLRTWGDTAHRKFKPGVFQMAENALSVFPTHVQRLVKERPCTPNEPLNSVILFSEDAGDVNGSGAASPLTY